MFAFHKALSLLCNQLFILKVVDLHGALYICQSFGSHGFSLLAACLQNFIDFRYLLFPLFSPLADWLQLLLQNGI